MGNREFDIRMTRWMNDHPAPCRRCKERSASCHGKCGRFAKWTRKKNEAREIEYGNSSPVESAYEKEQIQKLKARKAKRT